MATEIRRHTVAMRQLIAFGALALLACSKRAPSTYDAGLAVPATSNPPTSVAPVSLARAAPPHRHQPGAGVGAPPPKAHLFGATQPPIVNPAWSVTDWYFSSSGNDGNTCTDSGHPCKTFRQVISRYGTDEPTFSVAVTWHTLTSVANTDRFLLRPNIIEGGSFYLVGTWTQVASGTLSGVVSKSTSAADGRLQATLGAAATGHLGAGTFLVNATHASVAPVQAVLSGTTVALGQPFASNAPTAPGLVIREPAQVDTWANGDVWQLMQLPSVYVSALQPTSVRNDVSTDTNFSFIEHIYTPDPTGTPGGSFTLFGQTVRVTESAFDSNVDFPEVAIGDAQLVNSVFSGGAELNNALMVGGVLGSSASVSQSAMAGGAIDGDTILAGELFVESLGLGSFAGFPSIGRMCVVPGALDTILIYGPVTVAPFTAYGRAHLYGTYTLDISGASFSAMSSTVLAYQTTASLSFLGVPTFSIDGNATGCAIDYSVSPAQRYCGRTITPATIDAAIGGPSGSGFALVVHGYQESIIQNDIPTTIGAPSPAFVAGTCISQTYSGGQLTTAYTCTPGGGGVTSLTTTGAGLSCSPSTGSSVCQNTGVTSLTAGTNITLSGSTGNVTINSTAGGGGVTSLTGGTGISVSPTTGAAVVTLQTPVTSPNGGTGVSSPAAHSVMFSEGASPINLLASFTANHPMLAQGAGVDPNWAGYALAAPGTSGNIMKSNGTDWTSAPAPGSIGAVGSNANNFVALATSGTTTIATVTLTAVAGHLQIVAANSSLNSSFGPCPAGTILIAQGFSVDGATIGSSSTQIPDASSAIQAVPGSTFTGSVSVSAGSHTVLLFAGPGAASSCNTASGSLTVESVSL